MMESLPKNIFMDGITEGDLLDKSQFPRFRGNFAPRSALIFDYAIQNEPIIKHMERKKDKAAYVPGRVLKHKLKEEGSKKRARKMEDKFKELLCPFYSK